MKKSFQDYIIEISENLIDFVFGCAEGEEVKEVDWNEELIRCFYDKVFDAYKNISNDDSGEFEKSLKSLFIHSRQCNGTLYEETFHRKLEETLIEKNALYGNSFIETMNLFGDKTVLMIRLYDKIKRFESLIKGSNDTEDVTLDICGYILLYLAYVKQFNEEENECCGCCDGGCNEVK